LACWGGHSSLMVHLEVLCRDIMLEIFDGFFVEHFDVWHPENQLVAKLLFFRTGVPIKRNFFEFWKRFEQFEHVSRAVQLVVEKAQLLQTLEGLYWICH